MSTERRRLTLALLLSLLLHTLLLSLTFGGQGLGLPGFDFPWRERRIEAPDLHVVLVPTQITAAEQAGRLDKELLHPASIEQPVAGGPALTPSVSFAPSPGRTAEAIVPKAEQTARANPAAEAKPEPATATASAPAIASLRTEGSADASPTTIPETAVIAMERSDDAKWAVPPPPPAPTSSRSFRQYDSNVTVRPEPVEGLSLQGESGSTSSPRTVTGLLERSTSIADAPGASSTETVMLAPRDAGEVAQKRAEPEVRERAVEVARFDPSEREAQRQADQLEAARIEAARQEAVRQAALRQEAARVEAARQEAEQVENARLEAERHEAARLAAAKREAQRQDAMRQEAARQESMRQEAARQEAARQEAMRQEAMRQEAMRQEAMRQEAMRQEAARVEASRLEAERQAAVRQEAARVLAEQEEDARRLARRQAMGRQLDEEAARREAASTAVRSPTATLPLSLSTARRVRLWGRTDPNAELVQYAEAWARKIQFNTPVDMVRDVVKRPHTDPMVTVAIRSDGSVESVTFVLSSGVAEVDEAVRRIVQSHVPYQAFPPGLAREFDVVEIRRTWHFDMAIRLY